MFTFKDNSAVSLVLEHQETIHMPNSGFEDKLSILDKASFC